MSVISNISSDEILNSIAVVIQENLDVTKEQVNLNSRLMEDLGADSLDAIEVMMSLEDEFNTKFSDIGSDQMATVSDIVDYIKQHLDNNSRAVSS